METQNKTNEEKVYCIKCNNRIDKEIVWEHTFKCPFCFTDNKTAEDLINETETEPFTIEERTDLNIKKVVGK